MSFQKKPKENKESWFVCEKCNGRFRTKIFNVTIKKIPHFKKSTRSSYRDYYDEESREIVGELYKKDIELLDYTF